MNVPILAIFLQSISVALDIVIYHKYKKPENDKEIYFKLTESGEELYTYHEIKHRELEERNNKFFKNITEQDQAIVASFLMKFNNYLDEIIESEGDI